MNKIYNEKRKEITIHFVSDSTGETIDAAVVAVLAQFPEVRKKEFFWPLVRSVEQIENILENTLKNPGIVVYSILDDRNRKELENGCKKQKLRAHSEMLPNRAVNEWALSFLPNLDIQVEAKMKNQAAEQLHSQAEELGLV